MATLSFVHFFTTENLLNQDSLYWGLTVLLLFYPKYWTDSDNFENTQPCPYGLYTFKDKWNVLTSGMAKTKEYWCYTVELCSDRKILQADYFGCLKPMPHDAQVWSAACSHSACSCGILVQCQTRIQTKLSKGQHPQYSTSWPWQPACVLWAALTSTCTPLYTCHCTWLRNVRHIFTVTLFDVQVAVKIQERAVSHVHLEPRSECSKSRECAQCFIRNERQ